MSTFSGEDHYDRAIGDHDQAIQLKPDLAEAYANRGNVYYRKGDYDRAIADCNYAIQLKPDLAEAYCNRGLAYAHKGENDNAIADLERALDLSSDPRLRRQAEGRLKALGAK